MNIYQDNTTNFNNNGLGFLTDIISASIVDEINGEYSLSIEYPINGHLSEYLVEENYIKCKVADGTKQVFIIKNVEKTFDTIKVYANHIFYLLIDNFLDNVAPTNLNCETFLNWILARTNYQTPFVGHSDIAITKSARYVRKNPVEAILGDDDNSMVNMFGGEIKRDNYDIYFNTRIGADNGVKLLFGKNINEINITVDTTGVYTRIMPVGFDGLLLPELYVDSPLINNYLYPKICKYEFSDIKYDPEDEEAYHTLDDAYVALRNATNKLYSEGIDKPQINIKIDWIELSKTNEYKQYQNLETVNIGDTIYAYILGMELETRVIKTTYNPLTDMIESFEIGTPQPTTASYQNNLERQIEKVNPTSILEQAREDATELINSGFGGNVRIYPDRILIMDTDDETTAQKVWQWNLNGLGYSSTGVNGQYSLAMTSNGQIVADFITTGHLNTSVIQGYDSVVIQVADNTRAIGDRSQKTSTITQDIDRIEMEISDIADITTSSSSDTGYIADSELQNIEQSEPIEINIHPIGNNISYLYPQSTGLYPSDTLYMPNRILRFTNTSTLETFEYELPYDLLYYNSTNYDELSIDYESHSTTITKRCEYNADGTVSLLAQPQTITESFPSTLGLSHGNYSVQLLGYSQAFLFVRLMVVNAYTAQYPTRLEMNSAITQTANEINLRVSRKVDEDEVCSVISQSADAISISSNRLTIDSTNFKLSPEGNIIATSGTFGGTVNTSHDLTVGDNAYIGQNQSSSAIDKKGIYFSNNSYIERTRINTREITRLKSYVSIIDGGQMELQMLDNNAHFDYITNNTQYTVASFSNNGFYLDGDINGNSSISGNSNDIAIFGNSHIYLNKQPTIISDKRLKNNIKDIKVDWIDKLKVKEFEYNSTPKQKQIGLIAQDYINEDYSKYFINKNDEDYYSIAYGNITNALIQYCQELKTNMNKQQEIIEKLEKRIEVLENEK